jgi:GTPase
MSIKTIILDVAPSNLPQQELHARMNELTSLVSTYGGIVIVQELQKRFTPDYHTFVWSGKLDEIIALGEACEAELLIVWNILKPAQIYHINEILRKKKSKIVAWDRVDLILKIFALHANSPEAQLQIELAAIKHMWPRIYGMGMDLSRQWGGSKNAKWQGETNTEIMKRHLREQTLKIQEKLAVYARTRQEHRKRRLRVGLPTVWIVGYTNAGKSTLFNMLTRKWVLAEDKLFATLGTSVGKMYLESDTGKWQEILLNDTIGFIRDLPPNLIAAFSSTLEDSVQAVLLLVVVDVSDEECIKKLLIVEETLRAIHANARKLYVLNKVDQANTQVIADCMKQCVDHVCVSARSGEWKTLLKQRIQECLTEVSGGREV